MPVRDYGGNNHNNGRLQYTRKACRSLRCDKCKKLQYIPEMAFSRAAVPRCYKCGSTLIETERSYRRRTGKTKRGASKSIVVGIGFKPLKCPECGKKFRTRIGRQLHMEDNHPDVEVV
jgi:ribosomal protein S27E